MDKVLTWFGNLWIGAVTILLLLHLAAGFLSGGSDFAEQLNGAGGIMVGIVLFIAASPGLIAHQWRDSRRRRGLVK